MPVGEVDFSLLTDGLEAEREQGITIDVAYRSFDAQGRRILLGDAPGHEQYTRNMVTAAAGADVAILLVDAKNGITSQTRRHLAICAITVSWPLNSAPSTEMKVNTPVSLRAINAKSREGVVK